MSLQMLFYHRVALKVRTRAEQQPDEGGCMEPPAYMGQWQANYPGMALIDATPLMDPVLQVGAVLPCVATACYCETKCRTAQLQSYLPKGVSKDTGG